MPRWRLYLGDLVELPEELIQHDDQLLGGAVARQPGEAHDVGVQDAGTEMDESHSGIQQMLLTQGHHLNICTFTAVFQMQ